MARQNGRHARDDTLSYKNIWLAGNTWDDLVHRPKFVGEEGCFPLSASWFGYSNLEREDFVFFYEINMYTETDMVLRLDAGSGFFFLISIFFLIDTDKQNTESSCLKPGRKKVTKCGEKF